MRRFLYLFITLLFFFELRANEPLWPGFNASILMSQIGLRTPAVLLEPVQPTVALYSIESSTVSIFDPHYLNEAVLGIAFNENAPNTDSSFARTSEGTTLDITGCGCYLGGLGGVTGSASTHSGGGGSFSFYGSSSSYSLGGMGFGSGGGGGGNTPPDTPTIPPTDPPTDPPTEPPPTITVTVLTPEPATWMGIAGALLFVLIWKRKILPLNTKNETDTK